MQFLIVRWVEIENRQDIIDPEGNIIGMDARFKFLENKNVIIGGRIQGKVNETIELEAGTHTTRLSAPYNFSPKNMKIMLENTTALSPLEVRFEKRSL
jgi:hypothetical protein